MEREACKVWIATEMAKVKRDDKGPKEESTPVLDISVAGNERGMGQIVLRTEEHNMQVRIDMSDLVGSDGKTISRDLISVYRVDYVYLPRLRDYYPDALCPINGTVTLKPNETQPLWIEICVPKDAAAGQYSGTCTLLVDDKLKKTVELRVKVWNFQVPDKPFMRSAIGLWDKQVLHHHALDPESPEAQDLIWKYYWYLAEHKLSLFGSDDRLFKIINDDRFPEYIEDARVTAFKLPAGKDVDETRAMVERFRKNGWLDKAYFYMADEPVTEKNYEWVRASSDMIHGIDPSLKVVVPYFRSPDFDESASAVDYLKGYSNLWCPVSNLLDSETEIKKLQERKALGEEVWWYVCCGPRQPYANLFVEMEPIEHRILFWQQKKYDVQGFLYWSATFWDPNEPNSIHDPWEDMATIKHIDEGVYGDGSLLYPGRKVGIDGPVPSIRFKLLYKGIEDFAYLSLLEEKHSKEYVEDVLNKLILGLSAYEREPNKFLKIRNALGEALSK